MLNAMLLTAALGIGQTGYGVPQPAMSPTPAVRYVQAVEPIPAPMPSNGEMATEPSATSGIPEEPKEAPEDEEEIWPLMRMLEGTRLGASMEEHRFKIYGWAAMSYTASSASKVNTPVVWNDFANQFLLQQFWLRFERNVDTEADHATFGFHSDWLVGSDYRFTLARGIFNNQFNERANGLPNNYGVDPISFYVNAYFPNMFQGTEVKVGRWFTPFGVESLEAVSTPTVSRAYAFNWAPPFTHTGIIATSTMSDELSVSYGIAQGNDIFFTNGTEARFLGNLTYTPEDSKNSYAFGTSVGRGKFNDVYGVNHINVFDFVYNRQINDDLKYTFETIFGYQTNVARPDNGVVGTVHWISFVNYLFYTLSEKASLMARLEFFDDFQGARTGFEGLYTAATLGMSYTPVDAVILRPEIRYDYNGESTPFEGDHDIFTAALELILRY